MVEEVVAVAEEVGVEVEEEEEAAEEE